MTSVCACENIFMRLLKLLNACGQSECLVYNELELVQ